MNPGIVSADRHDHQIDGTGSAQLRKRSAAISILPAEVDTDFISFQRSSLTSRNRFQRSRSLVRLAVITVIERKSMERARMYKSRRQSVPLNRLGASSFEGGAKVYRSC